MEKPLKIASWQDRGLEILQAPVLTGSHEAGRGHFMVFCENAIWNQNVVRLDIVVRMLFM